MLLLLSPAKTLDWETPIAPTLARTTPAFLDQSAELIGVLRQQSLAQVEALMKISDRLAELNVARYAAWRRDPPEVAVRQAAFAFDGDVYRGLDAHTLDEEALGWAQEHVCILSGLYGVLRPLDGIQPYRLEMGVRLKTKRGADLVHFWGARLAQHLNTRLAGAATPAVVNLASQEYAGGVDRKALQARWVDCVFEDWKGGRYKIVSFHAKRARGLMARYAALNAAAAPEDLRRFDLDGYRLAEDASQPDRLVFRRRVEA